MQLKPPTPLPATFTRPTVFLAGSIELGTAEDWQTKASAVLEPLGVVVLNPRRDACASWDSAPASRPSVSRSSGSSTR